MTTLHGRLERALADDDVESTRYETMSALGSVSTTGITARGPQLVRERLGLLLCRPNAAPRRVACLLSSHWTGPAKHAGARAARSCYERSGSCPECYMSSVSSFLRFLRMLGTPEATSINTATSKKLSESGSRMKTE